LLDGHFEHPAWQLGVATTIEICDSIRGQFEFFRSLLEKIEADCETEADLARVFWWTIGFP
jgi:hypothetical protein